MKLLSIQMALFSEDFISRPDLLFNKLNEKMGGIVNEMPTILNLPPEAPAEMPIVQASSTDGLININISRVRIDLIIRFAYEVNTTPEDSFKTRSSLIQSFYKFVLSSIPVNRTGFVLTLFEPNTNGVKAVFDKYFSEKFSADYIESSMRINKKSTRKSVAYNNLFSVEAATITVNADSIPGVLFQYDINNVVEQGKKISEDTVKYVTAQGAAHLSPNSVKEMI